MSENILIVRSSVFPDYVFTSPPRDTRGNNLRFVISRVKSEVRKKIFADRMISRWTFLSYGTLSVASYEIFQRLLRQVFGDQLYEIT